MVSIEKILEEAATQGTITCPDCGNLIEPDAMECSCGWLNPLPEMGLI